ncbi:MAG TPA: TraR/DksA C4-type zinc finger protein [Pyrinomonadaceae bacterium]|nr:TraR/DksA C4-type zinc finger protein [Pyrinomonadaceae bacterium]
MSTQPNIQTDNPLLRHEGRVWNRLHSEREEICAALLEDAASPAGTDVKFWEITSDDKSRERKNRKRLEARLRRLDDALDRLIAGSYGDCSKCGRWIEDAKLYADPTLAFCAECQPHATKSTNSEHLTKWSLDPARVLASTKERSWQWRP